MTIYLIVGLPGAGKTWRARELEAESSALRLTPDEWLTAIFDTDGPAGWRAPEREHQRDQLEGKLIDAGMRAARLGVDVIFDFGFWCEDERSALRWIAAELGVAAHVVYLPIEFEEQRRRVVERSATTGQFEMSDDDLRLWTAQFETPGDDELRGAEIPVVDEAYASWSAWASARWPSLPQLTP